MMPIEKNTFIDSLSFSLKKSRGAMTKSANKNLPPQVLSETRKEKQEKIKFLKNYDKDQGRKLGIDFLRNRKNRKNYLK